MKIPCTWLGMTTNASNRIDGNRFCNASHTDWTVFPASFGSMTPSTTAPNKHSRCWIHMVMKYVPHCA